MSDKYLVVGAGKSGIAASELLLRKGICPVLYDGNENLDLVALKEKAPVFEDVPIILGTLTEEQMKEMEAYYVGADTKKVIYLTFDCGYENGNTELILDALKKHNAPATFFVVGHFLETSPELIKRMVSDGHTVGNHTYHHKDMSELADPATFTKEMQEVENLYQEITGTKMCPYYRPPQGKYDMKNLQTAKDMGYHTFFWSLAYVDWKADDQPGEQEALSKLTSRIHPGAIVLLHNTSSTNGKIMDKLLTEWEKMGYSFGKLEDLCRS